MSVESVGLSCPRCEAPVPADARFCMSCGQSLDTDSSTGARQARLAAAAPAPLVDKMRSAKLTGERKPVTAVFADIVGSTTLAESMDPEDWTQIVNEAFDLMSQAVFRYEGTIAQLQGDAMLAFFGAPVAHEDDPERAVRAALDMLAGIADFARELKASHDIDFRIRAGINTGPVIVGNVGSDLRYEYTALGDAMNVAARVQTAAEPGNVLVTAQTHRYIEPVFDFEDLGDIEVKGKADPLHVYRVVGLSATPGPRRGLAAVGLSSPLVGRATELDRLTDLYDAVRAGRGRVAVILGEPGLGKSRLLAELRQRALKDGEPSWIEGRCVSFGRTVPYHLVLDLVRSLIGIPDGASEAEARDQLHNRVAGLLTDEGPEVEAYLAHLLSLPLSAAESDLTQGDPVRVQSRYVSSIHRVIREMSAAAPVVVVCEDIHWADPSSADGVLQLLPHLTAMPVLVLLVGRPESDAPGWRLVDYARSTYGEALTEIKLQPLSDAHSRELVANLLEVESLPDEVRAKILSRAEGNPFFVEEVIRMLIERGAIVRTGDRWLANESIVGVEIPETLHSLLLARIDQLSGDAKRSLRVASVIRRQFPVRVLEHVLGSSQATTGER
jgi:class 3 adenylate cyclase